MPLFLTFRRLLAKLFCISPFEQIGPALAIVEEVLREVLPQALREVRLIGAETVRFAGHDDQVEAFVGLDEGVGSVTCRRFGVLRGVLSAATSDCQISAEAAGELQRAPWARIALR